MRTIAATTWSEYKQYFERDAALDRRFQLIKVEEPNDEQAIQILSGLKKYYQDFHQVAICDDALVSAVTLSRRYLTGKQLPDKAIDLIDTAAARVKMSLQAEPASVSKLTAEQCYLQQRLTELKQQRDAGMGALDGILLADLQARLTQTERDLAIQTARWQEEKALVEEILQHRATLQKIPADTPVNQAKRYWMQCAIAETQQVLATLQAGQPLLQAELTAQVISSVVSDLTGVPVNNLLKDDMSKLLELEQQLNQVVLGQDAALSVIAQALRTRRAGLGNPTAPQGVFLLAGPSGVGKTQTARVIADTLFGGEKFLVTINMSEYQEAHTVSQLKGSPPGYVGYGEGGILTEAVRQRPYSVVLLDEIEKAHPDVLNLFYQVFDRGILRDGEGREIDFSNTVIFMTTNLGAELVQELSAAETALPFDALQAQVGAQIARHFAPALLARMQVIPYQTLSVDALKNVAALKLDQLAQRLSQTYNIQLRVEPKVLQHLATHANARPSGARAINHMIEQELEPAMARQILHYLIADDLPEFLTLSLDAEQQIELFASNAMALAA